MDAARCCRPVAATAGERPSRSSAAARSATHATRSSSDRARRRPTSARRSTPSRATSAGVRAFGDLRATTVRSHAPASRTWSRRKQAQDEPIARPCHRDIREPHALGLEQRAFSSLHEAVVAGRLEPVAVLRPRLRFEAVFSVHSTGRPERLGAAMLRPISTTIGNSRPFDAWTVRMRTASSSGSGATASFTQTSRSACSRAHATNSSIERASRRLERPRLREEELDAAPAITRPRMGERELAEVAHVDDSPHHLADRQPVPLAVEAAEHPHRDGRPDARVASAVDRGRGTDHQLARPTATSRGRRRSSARPGERERGDDRDLVVRVADRAQHGQQVADLGCVPDEDAALDSSRDARGVEAVIERRQRRTRGHEDRDVGVRRRAQLADFAIAHHPPLALRLRDDPHDLVGLSSAGPRRSAGSGDLVADRARPPELYRDRGRAAVSGVYSGCDTVAFASIQGPKSAFTKSTIDATRAEVLGEVQRRTRRRLLAPGGRGRHRRGGSGRSTASGRPRRTAGPRRPAGADRRTSRGTAMSARDEARSTAISI